MPRVPITTPNAHEPANNNYLFNIAFHLQKNILNTKIGIMGGGVGRGIAAVYLPYLELSIIDFE